MAKNSTRRVILNINGKEVEADDKSDELTIKLQKTAVSGMFDLGYGTQGILKMGYCIKF